MFAPALLLAALHTFVVHEHPLRPFAVDVDDSGRVIRRVPLFFNSAQPARVFDPNPVVTLNDPSLMDENDSPSAVPARAYSDVTVDLLGPYTNIVDRQPPMTEQPGYSEPLVFDRGDDRFEPVNAVFHIDRMQRHLQDLGFAGLRQLVPYAIDVDALAVTGADASFFLPSTFQPGHGTLFYGTGGTDDAEDADLVVHEYGHAILEWISPGTFGGTFASESRAISEGFGDYLAFSAHHAQRVASGRDPFCFADWDARCWTDAASEGCAYPAGSDCLRRLDSTRTMADYERGDSGGVEHRNGQIWSSALREIFLTLGRDASDRLILESLLDPPPHPTFAVMARRLVETDRVLNAGVHRDLICGAFVTRGVLTQCDMAPRGELTVVPSADHGVAIPEGDPSGIVSRITIIDSRAIERLGVRVDIDHPSRGDLRVELVAPDGTTVLLQNASFELAAGIHATFGIDAEPAESLDVFQGRSAGGTWQLRVADLRTRDAGTLQSWALVIQYAGDEPQAQRPRGGKSQMIPVVAHLTGARSTSFTSDLRLANVTAVTQTATLIFTRSGEDGTHDFRAIDVRVDPGQTVAFDDVVMSAFFTGGSGSLEVLGDVLVSSRSYAPWFFGGTLGTQIPANLDSIKRGDFPLFAAGLLFTTDRYNLGITETAGQSGTVRVRVNDTVATYPIAPFSHLQFRISSSFAAIDVVGGDAVVVAYLSQVDDGAGDAMFIPALPQASRSVIAPAISAAGATARWQTDLWLTVPTPAFPFVTSFNYTTGGVTAEATGGDEVQLDAVATSFGQPGTAGVIAFGSSGEMFVQGRITNGFTTQYVPFLPRSANDQHILFVETTGGYRVNLGIAADEPAVAEAIVFDAAGVEVERHTLATPGGIAQVPVASAVTNGRALVRFLSGRGRGYASLIDGRSGDATFMPGQ